MVIETIQYITSNSLLLNSAIAITIFFASLIIGRIVGKVTENVMKHTRLNELLEKSTKLKINLAKIVSSLLTYMIYFFGTIMALNQFGIATTVLNIFSGAILILVLIFIFLAIKDFVPNMTAGLFIHSKGFLQEGDSIRLHDIEGKITYLNLVETRLQTKKGDIISIPNSRLIKYEVVKRKGKK